MKIELVKRRDGQAVISWPSVFLAAILITVAFSVGVLTLSLAVGWFSFTSFLLLPFVLGSVIGLNIKRNTQKSSEGFPPLGNA